MGRGSGPVPPQLQLQLAATPVSVPHISVLPGMNLMFHSERFFPFSHLAFWSSFSAANSDTLPSAFVCPHSVFCEDTIVDGFRSSSRASFFFSFRSAWSS